MFDAMVRRRLDRPLDRIAHGLDRPWMSPDRLSASGLLLGLTSAGLAAFALWPWALAAWLVSRLIDGLDGPLARRRGGGTEAGGFLDITADFAAYGAGVVGVAHPLLVRDAPGAPLRWRRDADRSAFTPEGKDMSS